MVKRKAGAVPVLALALTVFLSAFPAGPVFAGQQNSYHDPLEQWVHAADRTSEMDINSVVTSEVGKCGICETSTKFTIFRTPEYTKTGESAADREIQFSDGTKSDGESKGTIEEGEIYTGFHWTKSVCTKCGSINTNANGGLYAYGRNVYILYDCAEDFVKPLKKGTEYTYESSEYHKVTVKSGSYCGMCYGTVYKESAELEKHHFVKKITPEPGHGRFAELQKCSDCGYEKQHYIAAKSVVADYHGKADGKAHTVSITNVSDKSVDVSILFGNEADQCTMTDAPSYKKAGDYTVYYQIKYQYEGKSMSENGAAYIQLRESADKGSNSQNPDGSCSCGDSNCCCGEDCDGTSCDTTCTVHKYILFEQVVANCEQEGYDRYVCEGCGRTEVRNPTDPLGHQWETEVIREADCVNEGKVIKVCTRCGKASYETISCKGHQFSERSVEATCIMPGYTVRECAVCGERTIRDLKPLLPHKYEEHKVEASCLSGGHISHVCKGCGSSFITDYTDALGHDYDKGHVITNPTCMGSGVTEHECSRCGCRRLSGTDAQGHKPGEEASCVQPQICVTCGAILQSALGHDYQSQKVEPTEKEMGYTLYTCTRCNASYKTDYVPAAGKEETPEKSGTLTDKNGKAVAGGYLIFVNETASGRAIEGASVQLKENGDLSVILPEGQQLDCDHKVTVTVLNKKTIKPVPGLSVSVSDTACDVYTDITGADGSITVPGDQNGTHVLESHNPYMYGYPNGSFRADGNMTRAEASAVFARLLAERRGEDVSAAGTKKNVYKDVPVSKWYNGYIQYLSDFGILTGNEKGLFRPDESITRFELTAIAVRFYNVYSSYQLNEGGTGNGFSDVNQNSWAYSYINQAYANGWIEGYEDGTFRGENFITRAEMLTITNHLLNRTPDSQYIKENHSSIVSFNDLKKSHWAYEQIMEATNGHRSDLSNAGESWIAVSTKK